MHPLWWCQKLCLCMTSWKDWLSILFPQKKKALWGGSFAHVGRIKLPARLTVITRTEVEKGCTLGICNYACMVLCNAMKKPRHLLGCLHFVDSDEYWDFEENESEREKIESERECRVGSVKRRLPWIQFPAIRAQSISKSPSLQVHLFYCDALQWI